MTFIVLKIERLTDYWLTLIVLIWQTLTAWLSDSYLFNDQETYWLLSDSNCIKMRD
jgi:hypothetical protein